MRLTTPGLLVLIALASSQPVAAQTRGGNAKKVPDGAYRCKMWIGSSYVDLAAKLVGGVAKSDPLTKVGATITGVTPTPGGMTINYTTARGYRESMDCTRA